MGGGGLLSRNNNKGLCKYPELLHNFQEQGDHMKKWFILALIAAVFMVTFPACGGDEGDDGQGIASEPKALVTPNDDGDGLGSIIITWDGVEGYDYYVFFEKRDLNGVITPLSLAGVKGQTVFQFKEVEDAEPYWQIAQDLKGTAKNRWAIALGTGDTLTGDEKYYVGNPFDGAKLDDDSGTSVVYPVYDDLDELLTAIDEEYQIYLAEEPRTVYYRVGVAAANPGGYPMTEKRTLVYSKWLFSE